jgi:adenylate cyclase
VQKLLIGLALGLGAGVIALLLGRLPFVETIELKTYDWRMRATASPTGAHPDLVLVTIDETSLRNLDPVVGRWPWPRLVHAQLVNFLARGPAKVIVYDVLFTERDARTFTVQGEPWTGAESDDELARASAKAGTVISAANASPEETAGSSGPPVALPALPGAGFRLNHDIEGRPRVILPFPALRDSSLAVAHSFVVLDSDGPLRRYVPFIRVNDAYMPSLAVAGAMKALQLPPDRARLDSEGLWIGNRHLPLVDATLPSFYGESRRSRRVLVPYRGVHDDGKPTYREFPFYDLFYAEQQVLAGQPPIVEPAVFKDKIVVVGATAAGLFDLFTVPLRGKMPGAQVHASVIDSILSNRFLRQAGWLLSASVTLLAGLAAGVAVVLLGPWVGLGVTALGALGLVGGNVSLFGRGLWLALTAPLLAVALAAFGGVAYHYFFEGREKRKVKRLFSRYVSKDVYNQLLANPGGAALGGHRRHMTVLFSDIRGFTSVSEKGDPEEIVGQLNEYFSRMVEIVFAHRGTVDKFVGDMIMALFGAPLDDDRHADHAVQTAIAMAGELDALNQQWAAAGRPRLDIGIGISTGDMVAGNIGSESIMSYTVIGDTVNLGARLESLNKDYKSRIIISEQTRMALKETYDLYALGQVTVKGKSKAVTIFEVVVPGSVAHARGPEFQLAEE